MARIRTRRVATCLLILYALFLIVFVLLKFDGSFQSITDVRQSILQTRALGDSEVNLVLGRTVQEYLSMPLSAHGMIRFFGGIGLFVPVALLGMFICKRPGSFCAFILGWGSAVTAVVCIEVLQFVCAIGFFDIDDILLGIVGGLVGATVGAILAHMASAIRARRTT